MTSTPFSYSDAEIVYQDRFGSSGRQTSGSIRSELGFVYPEQAYSYQVHLLSLAGMQESLPFIISQFHRFRLRDNELFSI